jgi:cell division protein FtsZ
MARPKPRSATRCWTTSTFRAPTASWSTSPPAPTSPCAEFDEVGRTIEEFASEDATVVIGTVLDHDMQDEVRVTVVATGLNRNAARQPVRQPEREVAQRPVKLVRNATTGLADYGAMPNAAAPVASSPARAKAEAGVGGDSMDYLDIPAFLRRQAD